jgi:hypothetical protein
MRDVSRMLDAMEAPPPPGGKASGPSALSAAAPLLEPAAADVVAGESIPGWLGAVLGMCALACGGGIVMLRRRRQRHTGLLPPPLLPPPAPPPRPSLAGLFATDTPTPLAEAIELKSPEWVYEDSPYATPLLYVVPEPVDLLIAPGGAPTLPGALVKKLQGIDANPSLHLLGDGRFPEIRCVGEGSASIDAWLDIIESAASGQDDDARLARWLAPAVLVLRSRELRRREAESVLEEAAQLTRDGMNRATDADRPHWVARAIRVELARIERLSGATRLFALRALQSRQTTDLGADEAPVIDAWIDVQLAWAGWLLGGGAAARQAEAEALCDRLSGLGAGAPTRALRRRADVFLQRAEGEKTTARLASLNRAQALLERAYTKDNDAGTALVLARCARLRAMTLPPADAEDVCTVALTYAFIAEQDPAWRMDALECRLAIQLTYEALPGRAVQGEVAASLGRELASMEADSVGARTAMAATRLREGDFAGACALCEAAWRSGGDDTNLLNLWRDACRSWTQTAETTGHDRHALAHAVRQLAIARATLPTRNTAHP